MICKLLKKFNKRSIYKCMWFVVGTLTMLIGFVISYNAHPELSLVFAPVYGVMFVLLFVITQIVGTTCNNKN